jgi:phage tail-like protein
MVEDDFLERFVTIFQRVADTILQQIDNLPHAFDPTVAPDAMVRLMAEWFGVNWVDSSLDDRLQRRIVIGYADLIRWRGTARGLTSLLELLTGGSATVVDNGGIFPEGESPDASPHIRLEVESAGWNKISDLVEIVRSEIPAVATWELWVAGSRVWPDGTAGGAGLPADGSLAVPPPPPPPPPPPVLKMPPPPPGTVSLVDPEIDNTESDDA